MLIDQVSETQTHTHSFFFNLSIFKWAQLGYIFNNSFQALYGCALNINWKSSLWLNLIFSVLSAHILPLISQI